MLKLGHKISTGDASVHPGNMKNGTITDSLAETPMEDVITTDQDIRLLNQKWT